ncbi:hypothetical protein BpHYR1_030157 [Brachionus plicatilis]|uniref:FERM domain-containing protein n=1 Tax=Brachionus plicatilis TaxID=10195 RepID=A0A3M7R9E1_BRAPC|nr:hypothetical protein BpHYR1_030157 [Brachionus plicatilis]
MKIDKNSDSMNSSKRDKSVDKKEKQRLEKEKRDKEKQEKKAKELLEKQKKEQEKVLKKTGQQQPSVSASQTTSDLNKITKQNSKDLDRTNSSKASTGLTASKSENVLNKLKKPVSIFSSSSSSKKQSQKIKSQSNLLLQQQQSLPKGRFRCQVVYLDESVKQFDLDKNAIGEDLMTMVANDLELVEKEYFSLTYRDINNMKFWLDHDKKIRSQLKGQISTEEPVFNFEVKFYPPEPNVLQEEITRYLLTLQLRHDIMDGKLPCTFVTQALLGSFTVQAEMGDYEEAVNSCRMNGLSDIEYLEGFCFTPNQTPELLNAIAECHKDHVGLTPAEAELSFLNNAVKLAMYGVDLHNAKDSDGVDILIGVSASGLLVFRDSLRINRFSWPKILKISYKRNHFYLKLRSGEYEKYETTIGFRCPNHKSAKRLWKIAVEHHAFFRLREPESKKSSIIPTFNSKFRYTGSSTYMQARHRSIERSQPAFDRSFSKRMSQSTDRGLAHQNLPNNTPGSSSLGNYNRMKPNTSIGNLPRHHLKESQEDLDLDLEQGADYDLNDEYELRLPSRDQKNLPNMTIPGKNFANVNFSDFDNQNNRTNSLLAERSPKQSTSNYRSNESNRPVTSNSNISYDVNRTSDYRPVNFDQNQNEPLEEYYTSVDKNYQNDENRQPSIKHPMGKTIESLSNMNKISTPLASPAPSQPPQMPQRYVPARQISQETNQARVPSVSNRSALNSVNSVLQEIPLADIESDLSVFEEKSLNDALKNRGPKPNDNTNHTILQPKPAKSVNNLFAREQERMIDSIKATETRQEVDNEQNSDFIRQILNKNFEKYEKNLNILVGPEPTKTSIRSNASIQAESPSHPQRYSSQQIPTANSSIRSIDQNSGNQVPQPIARIRQPPPPIPADRSKARQNDSIRYQNAIDQQNQNLPTSMRQVTSSASSFARPNETPRSGSISSNSDATRTRKYVTNEEVYDKELLLRAIKMATDLDPNLEVEKVEISVEE